MSDETLRCLERRAATDPQAHVVYRRMLVRLVRGQEAGLEVGDVTVYRGHRLRIDERSQVGLKNAKGNGTGGRRVRLSCAGVSQHDGKWVNVNGRTYCGRSDHLGWKNLDSKAVGVLVEPADPPGERLPVGEGQHGPYVRKRDRVPPDPDAPDFDAEHRSPMGYKA